MVMAEYNSKTKPNVTYRVYRSQDGKTYYCDCWQWKKTRTCSHLEHYLSQVLPTLRDAHERAKVYDNDGALTVAIDKAISELN